MRVASAPETSAPCAIASGTNANTVPDRNARPPMRSACMALIRSGRRETCQRNRPHTTSRKYQRSSRNWNIGTLT